MTTALRKLRKLTRDPVAFFADAQAKRRRSSADGLGQSHSAEKIPTYVVGFSTWKQFFRKFFPERELIFLPRDITEGEFNAKYRREILSNPGSEVFIWGFKAPAYLLSFLQLHGVRTKFVEDGFVRSVQLGATKTPPMSICLDSRTPYFDARKASDLEVLLGTYDFAANPALLERAERGIRLLLETGISKYNNASPVDISTIYGPKTKPRVLVLGQVEDDASIRFGCDRPITNNDVVRLAAQENPDAQIIYKPHPDVLSGHRPYQSDPNDVNHLCRVLREDIPLAQAFETIDHVYSITSLAGFEALLRGLKVTTIGCPFYAGWGLTDDRQPNSRRTRTLSLQELFAGAYLVYPRYFDPDTGASIEFEDVVHLLSNLRTQSVRDASGLGAGSKRRDASVSRQPTISEWYAAAPGAPLRATLREGKPVLLKVPGGSMQSDHFVSLLEGTDTYAVVELDMIRLQRPEFREAAARLAHDEPHRFRQLLVRRLLPIRERIAALLFFGDGSPTERIASRVCEELGIRRVLIPVERFGSGASFGTPPRDDASDLPEVEVALVWDEDVRTRLMDTGLSSTPVVLCAEGSGGAGYAPTLSSDEFRSLYQLPAANRLILFLWPERGASEAQQTAIQDIALLAEELDATVLVRLTSSIDAQFERWITEDSAVSRRVIFEEHECALVGEEEAIAHADLVVSTSLTSLVPAARAERPVTHFLPGSVALGSGESGPPVVRTTEELREKLAAWKAPGEGAPLQRWEIKPGDPWRPPNPSKEFWAGVRAYLGALAKGDVVLPMKPSTLDRILRKGSEPVRVGASEFGTEALARTHLYFRELLNVRNLVQTTADTRDLAWLSTIDVFFRWGLKTSKRRELQNSLSRALGRPTLIVEDGFIRSVDIGLSGEPGLSIILDDTTAYYDATRASRLERLLENGRNLDRAETDRSRSAIDMIVRSRVSKYNHAPNLRLNIGRPGIKKVLLLDQRFGDLSVEKGMADESSFSAMLQDAMRDQSGCDILIKQHPDAIKGGKLSYLNNERLAFARYVDNVHVIDFDVNPYALLDLVDEVYVVTSGMGFEALMAGKKVRCYGIPFYAGWGLTSDRVALPRRTRRRSLEEVFHFAYIESSRYYHPAKATLVEVEELVDFIVEKRGW